MLAVIRKIFVLVAVCFAMAFQVRELYRQPKQWSFLDGSRCYLYDTAFGYDDRGWNLGTWFTLLGMTIYTIALAATLCEGVDKSFNTYEKQIDKLTQDAWCRATSEGRDFYKNLKGSANQPAPSKPSTSAQQLRSIAIVLKDATIAIIIFIAHQSVAYWSYANGFEAIQVVLYTYSVIMETYVLYKPKAWNSSLIDGDETSWGFGQCLPMILLSALLFSLGVAFREKHYKTA